MDHAKHVVAFVCSPVAQQKRTYARRSQARIGFNYWSLKVVTAVGAVKTGPI